MEDAEGADCDSGVVEWCEIGEPVVDEWLLISLVELNRDSDCAGVPLSSGASSLSATKSKLSGVCVWVVLVLASVFRRPGEDSYFHTSSPVKRTLIATSAPGRLVTVLLLVCTPHPSPISVTNVYSMWRFRFHGKNVRGSAWGLAVKRAVYFAQVELQPSNGSAPMKPPTKSNSLSAQARQADGYVTLV